MRNLKKIGRVILTFLLMFVVAALIGILFMKHVLLNAKDLNQQLADSPYYTQIEESLSAKFKSLSLETSIPEEVFAEAAMDQYALRQLCDSLPTRTMNKHSTIWLPPTLPMGRRPIAVCSKSL